MQQLTGVFTTDGIARSGERFPVSALEDMLWQSYRKGTPSNISHDVLRPVGWSKVSSLYVSHEMSYVLGNMFIPDTNEEYKTICAAQRSYLNNLMIDRINRFSNAFFSSLSQRNLLASDGRVFANGIVMYESKDIIFKTFPFLTKDSFDGDGLISLGLLLQHFDYKGCGVFAAKKSEFALLMHPYLRRSLSRLNNFNTGFIDELFKANSGTSPVRIKIDESVVGFTPSYVGNIEFEFWFGPSYSDDIMGIPEGVTTYGTNDIEKVFHPVCKTEFLWENKDGKRQFEMEEVADESMPALDGKFGCRYLHSFYVPESGIFEHFDGAIRMYDKDLIMERRGKPINQMGHRADYTKLFRIDGKLPIHLWKSLITQYLKDNMDVYRYFGIDEPFKLQAVEKSNDDTLTQYVPYILSVGDGVRLLVSYHEPIKDSRPRFFSHFDEITTTEGKKPAADLLCVDLAKSLRRNGAEIEYGACKYVKCDDGISNLPAISHGGSEPQQDVNASLNGIRSFLEGLRNHGNNQNLSFGLAWNINEDRSVMVSFLGAIPDILDWLQSFTGIPVNRTEFRVWLEKQVKYIHKNGYDDNSPHKTKHIQPDGVFFMKRRCVKEDATISDLRMEDGGLVAKMDIPDEMADLNAAVNSNRLSYIPLYVVDSLLCEKTEQDYLSSPLIAAFDETTCRIQKILSMNFVWCRP